MKKIRVKNGFSAPLKIVFFASLILTVFLVQTGTCKAQASVLLSASAKTAFDAGNFEPCIKELTGIIAREPKNDVAYGERSRCYFFSTSGLLKARSANSTEGKERAAFNQTQRTNALADAEKALNLNPKNIAAYLVRGNIKWLGQDFNGAIADFNKVIEIDPKSYKAYNNRAGVNIDLKDFDGAIADYTKIIELEPKNADAYIARALVKRKKGVSYYEIINADLNKIYEFNSNYQLLFELAGKFCLEDKGDGRTCAGYFKKAIELDSKKRENKLDFATAVLTINDKNTNDGVLRTEAASYLQKEVDAGEADAKTFQMSGNLYELLGDYSKAEEIFAKWIAKEPTNSYSFAVRADYYRNRKMFDKSIADYTKAISLAPNYGAAYRNRGVANENKNDIQNALADYSKALELDQKDGNAFVNRGNLFYKQNDFTKALADLNRAVALETKADCVKLYRGRIYLETGDYNAASSDFYSGEKCGLKQFYLGELEYKRGSFNSAISAYNKAYIDYEYYGYDTAQITTALKRAQQAKQNATTIVSGNSESNPQPANNQQNNVSNSPPSPADQSHALTAYFDAMNTYRAARYNYQDAVSKYNKNIAANANMQGMMSGTVARARQQRNPNRKLDGNRRNRRARTTAASNYDQRVGQFVEKPRQKSSARQTRGSSNALRQFAKHAFLVKSYEFQFFVIN